MKSLLTKLGLVAVIAMLIAMPAAADSPQTGTVEGTVNDAGGGRASRRHRHPRERPRRADRRHRRGRRVPVRPAGPRRLHRRRLARRIPRRRAGGPRRQRRPLGSHAQARPRERRGDHHHQRGSAGQQVRGGDRRHPRVGGGRGPQLQLAQLPVGHLHDARRGAELELAEPGRPPPRHQRRHLAGERRVHRRRRHLQHAARRIVAHVPAHHGAGRGAHGRLRLRRRVRARHRRRHRRHHQVRHQQLPRRLPLHRAEPGLARAVGRRCRSSATTTSRTATRPASAARSCATRRGSSSPAADNTTNEIDVLRDGTVVDASLYSESILGKINFQPSPRHAFAVDLRRRAGREAAHQARTSATSSRCRCSSSAATSPPRAGTSPPPTTSSSSCAAPPSRRPRTACRPRSATLDPTKSPHTPLNSHGKWQDQRTTFQWNAFGPPLGAGNVDFPRDQANAAFTWFLTNNELKFGVDWQDVGWETLNSPPDLFIGQCLQPQPARRIRHARRDARLHSRRRRDRDQLERARRLRAGPHHRRRPLGVQRRAALRGPVARQRHRRGAGAVLGPGAAPRRHLRRGRQRQVPDQGHRRPLLPAHRAEHRERGRRHQVERRQRVPRVRVEPGDAALRPPAAHRAAQPQHRLPEHRPLLQGRGDGGHRVAGVRQLGVQGSRHVLAARRPVLEHPADRRQRHHLHRGAELPRGRARLQGPAARDEPQLPRRLGAALELHAVARRGQHLRQHPQHGRRRRLPRGARARSTRPPASPTPPTSARVGARRTASTSSTSPAPRTSSWAGTPSRSAAWPGTAAASAGATGRRSPSTTPSSPTSRARSRPRATSSRATCARCPTP